MKLKKGAFLLLVGSTILSSFYFTFKKEVISEISESDVVCISSGHTYSTTGFQYTRNLNSNNGKYADFYIENVGEATFLASINGKSEYIFEPGEKGHIYMEVKNGFLDKSKEYIFKAASTKESHGQEVGIYYKIGQTNNQQ